MLSKYKITNSFGSGKIGDIINCFVIAADADKKRFLVYHPSANLNEECDSIEICKFDEDGYLVSVAEEGYMNFERQDYFIKFIREALFKLNK